MRQGCIQYYRACTASATADFTHCWARGRLPVGLCAMTRLAQRFSEMNSSVRKGQEERLEDRGGERPGIDQMNIHLMSIMGERADA